MSIITTELDVRPSALPAATAGARLGTALGLGAVIAFALSLQYFAQPFVWRNWPVEEVLEGWLFIFRDRLIVTVLIAAAISATALVRTESLQLRAVLLAVGVVIGAVSGELIVRRLYGQFDGSSSLTAHALRWSAVALAVSAMFYLWRMSSDANEQLRNETLRRLNTEHLLTNTRLAALRSQIEPHFLFNTLATLRWLQRTEPEAGARMLASFIDYLRRMATMLECSEVSLGEEIDLMRAYLEVVEMRMGGRLHVAIDVPLDLRRARVPPLALATLVENAVKHGISPAQYGGEIAILAHEVAHQLVLSVTDTGAGFNPGSGSGTGIGLSNVCSRLSTLYGALGSLRVEANTPTGVRATLRLPCHLVPPQ
ncbi:MAG TPA: histidine kinase [Steroidobacteraceae bacterium]|nr:histidine kinase [Steroidobacteraceae bacterium]